MRSNASKRKRAPPTRKKKRAPARTTKPPTASPDALLPLFPCVSDVSSECGSSGAREPNGGLTRPGKGKGRQAACAPRGGKAKPLPNSAQDIVTTGAFWRTPAPAPRRRGSACSTSLGASFHSCVTWASAGRSSEELAGWDADAEADEEELDAEDEDVEAEADEEELDTEEGEKDAEAEALDGDADAEDDVEEGGRRGGRWRSSRPGGRCRRRRHRC
ncbi:hypothetical protein STCU_11207 [Strigomonas culicis]|uniref:Uncharacterized protein n=1 Tax=Strigomonas culicis TaxID=28005 RepID=S9TJF4_9TRYP|nr:hypothetical protein STCU_11207 [Strigomonas culicis]|eukprot:EPY16493.1 hypothetical protein STCU_11207 [Strigomonas culicis]